VALGQLPFGQRSELLFQVQCEDGVADVEQVDPAAELAGAGFGGPMSPCPRPKSERIWLVSLYSTLRRQMQRSCDNGMPGDYRDVEPAIDRPYSVSSTPSW
jgi:hypothetical protein